MNPWRTIITDDGREFTANEVADTVPARPHVAGECGEGCWACWLGAA
jgi:hypothetical protein